MTFRALAFKVQRGSLRFVDAFPTFGGSPRYFRPDRGPGEYRRCLTTRALPLGEAPIDYDVRRATSYHATAEWAGWPRNIADGAFSLPLIGVCRPTHAPRDIEMEYELRVLG